jgi:hypothetical protein
MAMADRPERTTHYATLFETITGQTTITERQQTDISVRIDDPGEESTIADYVSTTATDPGFEDVIENPETY